MNLYNIEIKIANKDHEHYAEEICMVIADSARKRGTGIAKREPQYILQKIDQGKAVIALTEDKNFAGFCYIESWGKDKNFVVNSGLIVAREFRGIGLGKKIKKAIFELSREKYPDARLFGITTSPAVMKINYALGYRPVAISQLTDDDEFWNGCKSCQNYDILQRTKRSHCLCTAMLFDPEEYIQIESQDNKTIKKLSA